MASINPHNERLRKLQADMEKALHGLDYARYQADKFAEADRMADATAESPANTAELDPLFAAANIDPADPWAALRMLKGDAFAMRAAINAGIEPAEARKGGFAHDLINEFGRKFEDQLLGVAHQVDLDAAVKALNRYAIPDTGETRRVSGLLMQDHGLAAHQIIAGAQESLSVGIFQMEHPSLLADMMVKLTDGTDVHIHTFRMFTGIGKLSQRVLERQAGRGRYSVSQAVDRRTGERILGDVDPRNPDHVVAADHFKFIAADLHNRERAAFMLGSANATLGAMGRMVDRFGNRMFGRQNNIELSFVANLDMVKSGELREAAFDRMLEEARNVDRWINGDAFEAGTATPKQLGAVGEHRYLLSNRDLKTRVLDMIGKARSGDTLRIMSDSIDHANRPGSMLEALQQKILQSGGNFKVEILVGNSGYEDATKTVSNLEAFQEWADQHGFGSSVTVKEFKGTVHTKAAFLETMVKTDSGEYRRVVEQILGSMRFGSGMWEWETGNENIPDELRKYGNQRYRDLGVHIDSDDLTSLLAFADDRGTLGRIFRMTNRVGKVSGPPKFKADEGVVKQLHEELAEALAARKASSYQVQQLEYGTRFTVGGPVTVQGRLLDVGRLFSFSVVTPIDGFGPQGHLYIPEFSKFVGDVAAASDDPAKTRFERQHVVAAAVDATQSFVQSTLEEMAKVEGVEALQRRLADPFERGKLKRAVREFGRGRFENFAGLEPGHAAYNSKAYARLLWGTDQTGRLDMSRTFKLSPRDWEFSVSEYARLKNFLTKAPIAGLANLGPVAFMAGGLSRFSTRDGQDHATPARLFELDRLVSALPVAANLRDEQLKQDIQMFLLPASKAAQLPQRLQNLMSARDLGVDFASGLSDESRIVGEDGKVRRGVRFRGYALAAVDSNNAFAIAERFAGQYFEDPWQKVVSLPGSNYEEHSVAVLEELIDDLRKKGNSEKDFNKYAYFFTDASGKQKVRITASGLAEIKHILPVAESRLGEGTSKVVHGILLPTARWEGASAELVLDLSDKHVYYDPYTGKRTRHLEGSVLRLVQSGDRSITGGKNPYAFITEDSALFRGVDELIRGAASETYQKMQLSKANVLFGVGNIKTGDVVLQTGLEVLESGLYRTLLDRAGDAELVKNLQDFTKTFRPYLEDDVIKLLDNFTEGRAKSSEIKAFLKGTAETLRSGRKVAANQTRHLAAAFLGFSLMATDIIGRLGEAHKQDPSRLARLGIFSEHQLTHNFNIKEMSVENILGIIPISYVGSLSAAAVTMSSRNKVNFLAYHSGAFTDAIMNLMSMAPDQMRRNAAIRELTATGIMGIGSWDHVGHASTGKATLAGGFDFEASAFALPGLEAEFAELSKLHARLREDTLSADEIQSVKTGLAETRQRIKTRLDTGAPITVVQSGRSSADVQAVLKSQQLAGLKARTVVLPEFGRVGRDGKWVHDPSGLQKRFRSVQFLSPEALKAVGSFQDYSHEIQALQIEIEQKLHALSYFGQMDEGKTALYEDVWNLVGELQVAQREAMTTNLQQYIGGRMAMHGHNMIAGYLPNLKAGTMVLGRTVYESLKTRAVGELLSGLDNVVAKRYGEGMTLSKLLAAPEYADVDGMVKKMDFTGLSALVDATQHDALVDALNKGDTRAVLRLVQGTNNQKVASIIYELAGDLNLKNETRTRLAEIFSTGRLTLGGGKAEVLDKLIKQLEATRSGEAGENELILRLERERAARARAKFQVVNEADQARIGQLRDQATSIRAKADRTMGRLLQKYNLSRAFIERFVAGETARHESHLAALEDMRDEGLGWKDQAETHAQAHHQARKAQAIQVVRSLKARADHARETHAQATQRADQLDARVNRYYTLRERESRKLDAMETKDLRSAGKIEAIRDRVFRAYSAGVEAELSQLNRLADEQRKLAEITRTAAGELTMRSEAAAQSLEALKQSGADRSDVERIENQIAEVDRAIESMRTIGAKRVQLRIAQARKAQKLAQEAHKVEDKIAAEESVARSRRRKLKAEENDAERSAKNLIEGNQKKKIRLTREVKARESRGVVGALDALLDDRVFRSEFMKGLFQRAGAPMGPYGVSVQEIITIDEYNEQSDALKLETKFGFNNMSMWVSTGTMMMNLGDYDGDTASVALFAEYARLKTVEQLKGTFKSEKERARWEEVKRQGRYSADEIEVHFARNYTGDDWMFSEKKLYGVNSQGQVLDAIEKIHDIRERYEQREKLAPESRGQIAITDAEVDLLKAFNDRLGVMKNLAAASVQFTSDILASQHKVAAHIREARRKDSSVSTADALADFYQNTGKGRAIAQEAVRKMGEGLSKATISTSDKVLFGVFAATAFASTALIGQAFEMTYTHQMVTEAKHRRRVMAVAEEAREKLNLAETDPELLLDLIKSGPRESTIEVDSDRQIRLELKNKLHALDGLRHRELGGFLALQQIARTAIKPKGEQTVLEALAEHFKVNPKNPNEFAAGIEFLKQQSAVQALDAFNQLITGESLFGGTGEGYLNKGVAGLDQAVNVIKKGLYEFYGAGGWDPGSKAGDQENRLFEAGATRKEVMEILTRNQEAGGYDLFAEEEFKTWRDEGLDDKAMTAREIETLQNHLKAVATRRADELVRSAADVMLNRQRTDQLDYARAINDADAEDTRFRISADFDVDTKLRLFHNLTARSHMEDPTGMQWALADIFGEFDGDDASKAELVKKAQEVTNSTAYAEIMGDLYESWRKSGNNVEEAIQATRHRYDQMQDHQRFEDVMEARETMKLLGIRPPDLRPRSQAETTRAAVTRALTSRPGATLSNFAANSVLSGLLMGSMFGAAGTMGYASTYDDGGKAFAETMGMAFGMAITANGPAALAGMATHGATSREEASTRAGIFAASFGAGVGAGYLSEYLLTKANVKPGVGRMFASAGLSNVLGFVAGTLAGAALEAWAIKSGHLPSRQMNIGLWSMTPAKSEESENLVESAMDEVSEFVQEHVVEVINEFTGEVIAIYQRFANNESEDDDGAVGDDSVNATTFDDVHTESNEMEGYRDA